MTTTNIAVTGDTQSLSGNIFYSEVTTKGRSIVNFDFTTIDTSKNNILRVKIDYGDNTDIQNINYRVALDHLTQPITYYFALYGAYNPILINSHIYAPPEGSTYFKSLTAKFYIELSDDRVINMYFPIKIAQPSYYEEMGDINIGATQILSNTNNDIFCSIYDKTGDVSNIILS